MKIKKLPKKEFDRIYSIVPRLTVEVIVKTKKGIILTKRAIEPAKGKWHIPGGTVFKGETLEQAVKRVAKEELGIKVSIIKLLGIIEYKIKNYAGQPIGIAFLVRTNSIARLKVDAQAEEARICKTLPKNTEPHQKKFLLKHNLFDCIAK